MINPAYDLDRVEELNFVDFEDLNLGFFKGKLYVKLDIKNTDEENSYMVFNNDRINRNYYFYKWDTILQAYKLVQNIENNEVRDHRTFNFTNPNFKIDLEPNESASYIIETNNDGRSLDASPKLISTTKYSIFVKESMIWRVAFLGIIGCLFFFNFYQWSISRSEIYLYYSFYIMATFVLYLGLGGHLLNLEIKHLTIDHFIFISLRIWVLALILYTSKFLSIEQVSPSYYKAIKALLFVVLGGTTLYQFLFYNSSISHLHYFENIISSLWLLLILGMVIVSRKAKRLALRYYLISLSFFLLFISLGLIDGHFQNLPGEPFVYIKLGTIIEFIGFTYFIAILTKKGILKSKKIEEELKDIAIELEEKNKIIANKTGIEKSDLVGILHLLENSLEKEGDWQEFKAKFKQLNPVFLDHLLSEHPNLKKSDVRLLTLMKLSYSQKEIASMLNIAPDSVKKAKARVRKKLNLTESINLDEYLAKF
ncbi:MAG: hypothetical protein KDC82_03035 [Bacteroidetes bacterium]|nr:hypothetical protein [Bacteroidota bacterium]